MNKFQLKVLSKTNNPQLLVWKAMHQDYCEDFIAEKATWLVSQEEQAGHLIIKHLLSAKRGHWGPFEHPQITFAVGYFPHSTMQQLRTHRVGLSFDVQSFRYTGKRILEAANNLRDLEDVFYLRPCGEYTDRQGKKYEYTPAMRKTDLNHCMYAANLYSSHIASGMSEEHARSILPFDVRQHFVLSCNARSLMHILDLRSKRDAQLECQIFSDLLKVQFMAWMPQVSNWYIEKRLSKAQLSP